MRKEILFLHMISTENTIVDKWIEAQKFRFKNGSLNYYVINYLKKEIEKMLLENGCENILSNNLEIKLFWLGSVNSKEKQERWFEISIVQNQDQQQILCSEHMYVKIPNN